MRTRIAHNPTMPFYVACAQFAPAKAKVAENLDRIAEMLIQAGGEGADLVLFPEAAATGYFLEGGVLEAALTIDELALALQKRTQGKLDRPVDAVIGFYLSEGSDLFNAAAYLEIGPGGVEAKHVYRKFFLPTYGVFDEERFVSRGTGLGVFDTRLGKMAILICEDVWHSIMPTLCALRGAQVLLVPSASPARGFSGPAPENHDRYRRMLRAVSEEHGMFCVNAQLCGFEGGKGFIGGSFVTDPMGKVAAESPVQEEHLLIAPLDLDLIEIARAATPLISDLKSAWPTVRALADDLQN